LANPRFLRAGPSSWGDVSPKMLRAAVGSGLIPEPPPAGSEPARWAGEDAGYPYANPYSRPYGGDYPYPQIAPDWRDADPGPPLPLGFPRTFPSRERRLRVGVLSPCCYLGGADLWIADLLSLCDPSRIAWSGVAIRDDLAPIVPEVRASWEAHAPVAIGDGAIRALARASDVLVAWGVFHSWGFEPARLAALIGDTPLLAASHGSIGTSLVPRGGAFPRLGAAAVSRAALRALPEELRAGARIIYNAVDPARVAPTRPAAGTRRTLGIPAGAKVLGWLSRISAEKRPEVFVRALALLPRRWVAVVAGIGAGEAAMRALADEVAPGRAIFLGGRHDVGDVLATFDVMALPTISEACSLTVNECWLGGVPVICTATGMIEEHPGLARVVPNPPTPGQLAAAILADDADRAGTRARVARAREFAGRELATSRFREAWTAAILDVAGPRVARPAAQQPSASAPRSISPAVRQAILDCPDRGGTLTPLPDEATCCGPGPERTECRAGKGRRPGRVTLAECNTCRAEALADA
jgi:glycosyltransferase involved in cell wall biosynthesis